MEAEITRSEKKFIDLENVVRNKNPRLLRLLPGFVFNFIRRIIHENEINAFLRKNEDKYDFDFLNATLEEFGVKINVIGRENIPASGGYIFAANHPLGGLDGVAVLSSIGAVRKDVKFLVNDILLNLVNLKSLFIPVNKHGRNSPEIIQAIENTYASDIAVLVFPAGLVSRRQSKEIKDLTWKKSFVVMSRKYKKDIVPIFIEGQNTNFFYRLANLRKRVGIKANIEMFFLVNEMYKQKNKTITLVFGEPIPYQKFDETLTDGKWSEQIKEQVYSLKNKLVAID